MTIKVTYRKGDGRYYVDIDGEKAGWVIKDTSDGTWSFYSPVREALRGERLTSGNKTRRDAVMEGVSSLEIYHLGRIVRLNMDTIRDEVVVIEPVKLRALWQQLLDEKYPERKETA